jgi:uncharacterized protein
MENKTSKNYTLPVFAAILAIGLIVSSFIVVNGFVNIKNKQNTVTITGSAKKQFKSDFVVWRGTYTAQAKELAASYATLKSETGKVKNYLVKKGISAKDLVFSSITSIPNYEMLPNGQMSSNIESYRLMQTVEISSKDVDKITEISRQSTDLINQGIDFQSNQPEYFFTKIADLKIDMLSLATKDAMTRAEQIAKTTGSSIGKLRSAKMGVFQITPLYSTDVSDSGIYSTSSIDKEITAVMTCDFEIK